MDIPPATDNVCNHFPYVLAYTGHRCAQNWVVFLQYRYLAIFGQFFGPMNLDLLSNKVWFQASVETVVQLQFLLIKGPGDPDHSST